MLRLDKTILIKRRDEIEMRIEYSVACLHVNEWVDVCKLWMYGCFVYNVV
jgi:hypothetical protein